jgi:GNAT superfamily N-acetyltransferase
MSGVQNATIRTALGSEYDRARAAYETWGYPGSILPTDVVFVAERGDDLLGIVRRSVEHETVMLRGMQVDPAVRRRGIGTLLLRAFAADLDDRECFCVPFAHLVKFYGQVGFVPHDIERGPVFLGQRIERYRREGYEVLLMYRRAHPSDLDHPA